LEFKQNYQEKNENGAFKTYEGEGAHVPPLGCPKPERMTHHYVGFFFGELACLTLLLASFLDINILFIYSDAFLE
jgi:hypothetical protein